MAYVKALIGISGQVDEGSFERRPYLAVGYTTVATAVSAVASFVPATIGGLVLSSIEVGEQVENGWEVDATWGMFKKKEPPQQGETQFNFEIATQPVKVYVGVAPHVVYPASGVSAAADSARWLIGDQGDGERPDGVEVFEPTTSFSYTSYIAAATLTEGYRNTLMQLVGMVNNATYKGWAAGEILFAGISGSKRGASDWEVTFRFQARKNQTGLTVAGVTGVDKEGWQYLWPKYRLKTDGTANIISNVVDYIVVSTVFRSGNLSGLGI